MSDKKNQILKASLEVFVRKGYIASTIRQIASHAGISLGLLYNYYQGKEDILHAIFEKYIPIMDEAFTFRQNQMAEKTPPLISYIKQVVSSIDNQPDFWRLFLSVRFQSQIFNKLGRHILPLNHHINHQLKLLATVISKENTEMEARFLFAFIDGLVHQYILYHTNYPLEEMLNMLQHRYEKYE